MVTTGVPASIKALTLASSSTVLRAKRETLQARGVKVTVPPRDLGTLARIMLIADPDGNTIEFAAYLTQK